MRQHSNQFLLRLNDADKAKVTSDCQQLGYTNRTKYFRDLIQGNYPYINLYRELIHELRKQGVNINQTARYCNQQQQVDEEVLRVLAQIAQAQAELVELIRTIK